MQFLRARAAFLNFAVDYLRESPVKTKTWQPDDEVFEKLRDLAQAGVDRHARGDRRGVRRRRDAR